MVGIAEKKNEKPFRSSKIFLKQQNVSFSAKNVDKDTCYVSPGCSDESAIFAQWETPGLKQVQARETITTDLIRILHFLAWLALLLTIRLP